VPADAVTTTFREWGRATGFQLKGTTLYRDQPETVAVVNLQGSQWGGRYYVNVALWLKALGEADQPPQNQCHIRTRLTQLVPDPSALDDLLTANNGLTEQERGTRFRELLDEYLAPVLATTGTLQELRANRDGFLSRFLLGRDAIPVLDG
jgi:Domain of unknown function (DUF4304)